MTSNIIFEDDDVDFKNPLGNHPSVVHTKADSRKECDKYEKKNSYNVSFYESFLTPEESKELFEETLKNVKFSTTKDGKINQKRRGNATYGDDGLVYEIKFSNGIVRRKAIPWKTFPLLVKYKNRVDQALESTFDDLKLDKSNNRTTTCSIMIYPSGSVGIKPHRDKEMIKGTSIAGLSIGATRDLIISNNNTKLKLKLNNGSLYILSPPTNDKCSHSIPVDYSVKDIRISFTFRTY
jgi:alkylated DNA repair dioxygenase AlkB